jgi:hypothetical protein
LASAKERFCLRQIPRRVKPSSASPFASYRAQSDEPRSAPIPVSYARNDQKIPGFNPALDCFWGLMVLARQEPFPLLDCGPPIQFRMVWTVALRIPFFNPLAQPAAHRTGVLASRQMGILDCGPGASSHLARGAAQSRLARAQLVLDLGHCHPNSLRDLFCGRRIMASPFCL